jgi:L-alanine-DL-glutamate epimerase-like enolase superfamily enzyme
VTQIVRIEWATLVGRRPRAAGSNSRVSAAEAPSLGIDVRVPLARITAAAGSGGVGYARVTEAQARSLLGAPLESVFDAPTGARGNGLPFEFPLWDLAGRRAGLPVYALVAGEDGASRAGRRLTVPCYDTTLYFDDLDVGSDEEAAALMGAEARQGWERGHRAFKTGPARPGRA